MENNSQWVGIDVSKSTLDVYIRPLNKAKKYANDRAGISQLITEIEHLEIESIVLEATGGLERLAIEQLQAVNLPVAMINPRQGRDFAKATGKLAKTDAIDAQVLAHFGEAMKPKVLAVESESARQLADLTSRRRQLIEIQTAEKNRSYRARGKALTNIEAHLKYLEETITQLDGEIEELTKSSQEWMTKLNLVKSVPGIGKVIANTLVADLPELGRLNAKQIARLVGVAPINFDSGALRSGFPTMKAQQDSGQYHGKRRIAGGRAHIRAVLYMGALVAMRHNPVIKSFYTCLIERGKSPKLALTACVRKLLVILNAMVRDSRSWYLAAEVVTNPN
jgi:transposase